MATTFRYALRLVRALSATVPSHAFPQGAFLCHDKHTACVLLCNVCRVLLHLFMAPPLPSLPASQDAPDNLVVALMRDKPTACPASPNNISNNFSSAASTVSCGSTSGGLLLDMGNVCTAERTTLYLWVAVKGSSSVRAFGAQPFVTRMHTHAMQPMCLIPCWCRTPGLDQLHPPPPPLGLPDQTRIRPSVSTALTYT